MKTAAPLLERDRYTWTGSPATHQYHVYPRGDGKFNVSWRKRGQPGHGICNPMPGATHSFASIRDALLAIRCLEKTGGGQRFWDLYWRVSGLTQKQRNFQNDMARKMGMLRRATRHSATWEVAK